MLQALNLTQSRISRHIEAPLARRVQLMPRRPKRRAPQDHDRGSAISEETRAWGKACEPITHQLSFNANVRVRSMLDVSAAGTAEGFIKDSAH